MARRTIFDMSFEEEKAINDPILSLKWVAENYRNTYDKTGKVRLYEWENITFANTDIISTAAKYFQKHKVYTDIDPSKRPTQYKEFWDRWEYRRKKGMVLPCAVDKTGGNSDKDLRDIWIPPKMVGHLNFGPINRTKDPDEKSIKEYLETSLDQKKSIHKDEALAELFAGLSDKTVMDSTFDFPNFWDGHFHTWITMEFAEKIGLDVAIVKARRKGFSYVGAWDCFDEYDLYPDTNTLVIAYDSNYLTKEGGLFTFVKKYADFINQHTDWAKRRITNTTTEIRSGFKYRGDDSVHGFNSAVICLSAGDNPSCARGKKARKIKYEECGTFPNLLQTVGATKSSTESGGYTVGQSTYWGTVGDKSADYGGLKVLAYRPQGNDILAFNNTYDTDSRNTPSCLFFGQYQNYEGAMDKDGNSDIEKAKQLHKTLSDWKESNSDLPTFTKWTAERATTLAQALNRGVYNIFSRHSDLIQLQLNRIEAGEFAGLAKHGRFQEQNGEVVFRTNEWLRLNGFEWHSPIEDTAEMLPLDYDFTGCVTIWQEPFKELTYTHDGIKEQTPEGLYYIWHDPYAVDKDKADINRRDSIGTTYVYEAVNGRTPSRGDRIVASYLGRPALIDDYNEELYYLCVYYNVKNGLMFENNRGEVKPFFTNKKALVFLMKEPQLLSLADSQGKESDRYGITITPARKNRGVLLLTNHFGDPSKSDYKTNSFLTKFYCKRGLKEISSWNSIDNFDTVSALIVGQFQIRETLEVEVKEHIHETPNSDFNDFFNRNFF